MPVKSPFKRKCIDLKYNYGEPASEYFKHHPQCELCHERRIVCLTLHHVFGKPHDIYQTLCFNCHMYVEAKEEHKNYTYCSELEFEKNKGRVIITLSEEDRKALELYQQLNNKTHAAQGAGISRKRLYTLLKHLANNTISLEERN